MMAGPTITSAQQMFEYSKLAGSSFHAIDRQLKRLSYVRHKKFDGGHVNADDVAELDEIIKSCARIRK